MNLKEFERRFFREPKYYFRTLGGKGYWSYVFTGLSKTNKLFVKHRPDCKHPIYLRIPSSDTSVYRHIFHDKDYEFDANRTPEVIVDAGANIGMATVYFANRYPDAKIIALEPEPSNFEMLKKNTQAYPNVVPLKAALWNCSEDIIIQDPGFGKWGFMVDSVDSSTANDAPIQSIRGMTVDQLMEEQQLDRIDVFKIDIEGAEKEVFSASTEWTRNVDSMIVELHERLKPGCNRAFYNGSAGFNYEWQRGENNYLSRGLIKPHSK